MVIASYWVLFCGCSLLGFFMLVEFLSAMASSATSNSSSSVSTGISHP